MTFQYRFTHTCGHPGIGPIVNQHQRQQTSPQPSSSFPTTDLLTIPLPLPFTCPFCTPSTSNFLPSTPLGSGLLTLLNSTPTSPFPTGWTVLKACKFEEVEPEDWIPAFEGGARDGRFRQMAWIAQPCGEVAMRLQGQEEGGIVMKAGVSWRGGVDGIG